MEYKSEQNMIEEGPTYIESYTNFNTEQLIISIQDVHYKKIHVFLTPQNALRLAIDILKDVSMLNEEIKW